jgi:hypothetical protein
MRPAGIGVKMLTMAAATKTEEFIAMLHVIAVGEASEDRQKDAVRQVFTRHLNEAEQLLLGDLGKVRAWVTSLQSGLKAQADIPRSDSFVILRNHAQELVADWLQRKRD